MDGVTAYRINEKGVEGIWACERHIKQTDATIPSDVKALTEIIEQAQGGQDGKVD